MWACITGRHNALIKISCAQVSVIQTKLREPTIDSDNLLWFCLRHIKLAESTVCSWSFYLSLSLSFFLHPSPSTTHHTTPSLSNSVIFIRDAPLHIVCRLRRRNFLIYCERSQQPVGWNVSSLNQSRVDECSCCSERTRTVCLFLCLFFPVWGWVWSQVVVVVH